MDKSKLHFFLGGNDAEMATIKALLDKEGVSYSDAKLGWGAAASAYGDEIAKVSQEGKVPVTIELNADTPLPDNVIEVDHHNDKADRPASILQVCELLGVKPTREMQLIAANDSGYIPAMLAMGATKEEINMVRYKDRAAQGITPEQERQAEEALKNAREICGVTVVKMPHSKTATVTDRLFDPDKPQNVAIFSGDGEINYFGPGDICQKLLGNKIGKDENGYDKYDHFGGWGGGAGFGKADGVGFWGGYANHTEVLKFILTENQKRQTEKSHENKVDMAKFIDNFER